MYKLQLYSLCFIYRVSTIVIVIVVIIIIIIIVIVIVIIITTTIIVTCIYVTIYLCFFHILSFILCVYMTAMVERKS